MEPEIVLERLEEFSCNLCTEKFYRLKDWHKHASIHVRKTLSNKENLENNKCENCGENCQGRNIVENQSDIICKCKSNPSDTRLVPNNVLKERFASENNYDNVKPENGKTEVYIQVKFSPNQNETPKSSNETVPDPLASENENVKAEFKRSKKIKEAVCGYSNTYTCGQCSTTFKTFEEMSTHLIDHSGPPFVCIKCPKTFDTIELRNKHSRKTHKYEFECSTCHKIFNSKANLTIHLRVHTGERPYACEVCGKRFTQSAALYTHNKIHLGVKNHVCTYCNKPFIDYHNMKTHERIHTKERPFICRYCNRAFSDPSALKRHERTHTGDKIYHCEYCHMKFSDASGLIAHRRRHVGIKEFKCEFCSKKFYTRTEVTKHESSMHMRLKPFECDMCSKKFTLKQYLASHVIRSHLPRVQCRICKLKFFSNTKLQEHASKGCVEDKFECDICGIKVPLKVHMKTHMEQKHFLALYCHICMRRFYTDYHLQKHKARKQCTKKLYIADINKEKDTY